MGIIYADVNNLCQNFRSESNGKRVITLGRLSVYLHSNEIARLKKLFKGDKVAIEYLENYQWGEYSERFFKDLFKCSEVDSLDFSDFEGATVIHDLQKPIPDTLYGKYDLVFDGGTLEHVFNFPMAIANAMHLVKVDGLIYINTPSNNLSGHGFYQFSPELMFRVMSDSNGMKMIFNRIGVARFPAIEQSSCHRVYDVTDPNSVGRVCLLSSRPIYMMVMARKINEVELFTQPVLQSDYVKGWDSSNSTPVSPGALKRIFYKLPQQLQTFIHKYRDLYRFSVSNRQWYHRVR
jgi:hypothetical protein